MEADAEINHGALDGAVKVHLRSRRNENESEEVKTMMGNTFKNSLPDLMGAHHLQPDNKIISI